MLLRRVSVEMAQYAAAALQTVVDQLGARTASEWMAEHSARVTHSMLSRLLPLCPGATSIDLASFGRGAVTDEMLELVAGHCRALHVLQAAGPGDITDAGVRLLCRQRDCCATLRRVVLSENFSVSDAAVEALALAAPHLAEIEAEATGLSDGGLMTLAKSRTLRLLGAGYCRGVSDFGVRQLATCSGLVALNLTACSGVTGAGIAAVCDGCHFLKSLRVDQCTEVDDASLHAICGRGRLELLTIGQCTAVTDCTLELLGKCSTHLERLDLWGLSLITDDGIRAIAAGCLALQHLDVSRCPRLSDAGLAEVPTRCHRLRHLAFASCHAGTDTLLAAGAHCQVCWSHCANADFLFRHRHNDSYNGCVEQALEHLNANYSQQGRVSDVGLLAIANGCPALRHLEVCSSSGITDISLVALADNCRSIEHVDFSACPRVSDSGVKALAAQCSTLTDVYLGGCAVTDHSVESLRRHCPNLHYLFISCTQTSPTVANSTQGSLQPTSSGGGSALHIHR